MSLKQEPDPTPEIPWSFPLESKARALEFREFHKKKGLWTDDLEERMAAVFGELPAVVD